MHVRVTDASLLYVFLCIVVASYALFSFIANSRQHILQRLSSIASLSDGLARLHDLDSNLGDIQCHQDCTGTLTETRYAFADVFKHMFCVTVDYMLC